MVQKRIVCPDRIRSVPQQFSWIDHALVRKKYICGLSHESLALYLFLLTVCDADGLSYYSDSSINDYLRLDRATLSKVRAELCKAGLIAYSNPFYQVLSLHSSSPVLPQASCQSAPAATPVRKANTDAVSIGQILADCLRGVS